MSGMMCIRCELISILSEIFLWHLAELLVTKLDAGVHEIGGKEQEQEKGYFVQNVRTEGEIY